MTIRREAPADRHAVLAVHRRAFARDDEADLVARLKAARLAAASLVAEVDGGVIGHILFTWLPVTVDGRAVPAVALGPVGVLPSHQRQGHGTALIRHGLGAVGEAGAGAAIVLGDPGYYARFGFSAPLAARLAAPFGGDAFMALELAPNALHGHRGTVRYPAAWGLGT